ncbi:MAG: hypothetical protein IJ305_00085, partial [Oscillospiraceae bacterium]|nr:hypothetical protein [Oscillospiraceae bacterium]
MNMKKTIAAIAAGAVAVSAMATTVSALQDTALTYNLVEKTSVATTGTVVVSSTFNAVELKDGVIRFAFDDGTSATKYTIKGVSVTGRYDADSKQILPITRVTDINAENYSATLAKEGYLDVNVGAEKLLEAGTATFTVAVTLEHNLADWQNISAVNSDIADNGLNVNYEIATDAASMTGTGVKDDTVASQFVASGKTEYKLPFTTAIKGNDNIVNYLQTAVVNGDGSYVNVGAVLNDAIENYESVTFTFNTATSGIKWTDNTTTFANKYSADDLKNNNWDRSYFTAFYNDEWNADNSYKSFTQHLYNGTNGIFYTSYDSEGTGYT